MKRGRPNKSHEIDWDAQPLGVETDAAIAARLGCTSVAVGAQRRKRGILTATYYTVRTDIKDYDQARRLLDANTARDEETGCLIWTGKVDRTDGYGILRFRDKQGTEYWRAHRVAWVLAGKEIDPTKPYVCHSCDNRRCVEITHLWAGTAADNNRDRSVKDRGAKSKKGYPRGVRPVNSRYEVLVTLDKYSNVHLGTFDTLDEAVGVSQLAHWLRNNGATKEDLLQLRVTKRYRYRCCHWSYTRKPKRCTSEGKWWLRLCGVRSHSGPVCDEHAAQTTTSYREAGITVEWEEATAEAIRVPTTRVGEVKSLGSGG